MAARQRVESDRFGQFLSRCLRAFSRRAGEGDLEALQRLVELRAELDAATDAAARGAHDFGYSWTEIAGALGISRQAARQRFGTAAGE